MFDTPWNSWWQFWCDWWEILTTKIMCPGKTGAEAIRHFPFALQMFHLFLAC